MICVKMKYIYPLDILPILFISTLSFSCSQNPQLTQTLNELQRERKVLEEAYQAQQQKLQQLQAQIDELKEKIELQSVSKLRMIHSLPTEKVKKAQTPENNEIGLSSQIQQPVATQKIKEKKSPTPKAKNINLDHTIYMGEEEQIEESEPQSTDQKQQLLDQAFEAGTLEKARLKAQKRNFDQALLLFDQAIKENPDQLVSITLEKTEVYAINQPDKAIALLQDLLYQHAQEVEPSQILLKIGQLQIKNKQSAQAKATFQRLINIYPQSIYAKEAKKNLERIDP
jgi:tetratricopeptide (TPR) repeat protein